jgi:hypothetical protein
MEISKLIEHERRIGIAVPLAKVTPESRPTRTGEVRETGMEIPRRKVPP